MDALELLNVLDIIKNQDVYEKRFENLKAEQEKLQSLKDIVATVEQAKQKLMEAWALRDKHADELEKFTKETTRIREAKLVDLAKREELVSQREEEVALDKKGLASKLLELHADRQVLTKEQKILAMHKEETELLRKDTQKLANEYHSKIAKLRDLLNG